ncbi:MAG: hypothetical protein HY711_06245 [Candidatus Melainabacteria bacterium]|nr:hypothetical protein [Candidatus Melainabacteria bacterium]
MSLGSFGLLLGFPFGIPQIIAQMDSVPKLKLVPTEFVSEPGCPVAISSARTQFELDPFAAPLAARLYIEYSNNGEKPISAVKFRVRFTDESGHDLGTLHAGHVAQIAPGGSSSEKWRHEKVNPKTTEVKIRVLVIRYRDGSTWQSSKTQQVITAPESH